MDILIYISHFLYRIRYKLIIGFIVAALLSIYFTDFLPKKYNVTTTIFTGITSKTTLEDPDNNTDWNASNNAHDNIINLIQSKSTLEQISLHLLAQHLIHGDEKKDNTYISADNYKKLLKIVPSDVMALVDKSSEDRTVENFMRYKTEDPRNFIYGIFNWQHKHYSYYALKEIKVRRREASDMIEVSYQNDDPGVTMRTVELLNIELKKRYEDLLLSASNDVIKYFQEQLRLAAEKLELKEDDLVNFNTENRIINYEEQTKHLAALNNVVESRYEESLLAYQSSAALVKQLEQQMDTRTKLMLENKVFLSTLSEISTLNGKIAEMEIFNSDTTNNKELHTNRIQLADVEKKIKDISNNIDVYKYSKQGVVITDMVAKWLEEVIKHEKSKAELEVMLGRKKEINDQYSIFSPVGPNLNRKDREVKVAEESYLTLLHHLGLAHLKQKNILLNSGTLQIVTPPELPIIANARNRELYVPAAVIAALMFICGFYLILELIDRTLRDRLRTERLTGGKVVGAFPKNEKLKYRGFNKEVQRIAITHLANSINKHIKKDQTTIVNLLSIEPKEGKTYIAALLKEYWESIGFSVRIVSYETDFASDSKAFLQTESINELFKADNNAAHEIIIVEYAPLNNSSIPDSLLKEASINILIADACRMWKSSDQPLFDRLKQSTEPDRMFIYLNNANRESVEEFTGQLPPFTKLRRISYRLFNFGITANNA